MHQDIKSVGKRHMNCKLECCSKGCTWLERQGCSLQCILARYIPIGCKRFKTIKSKEDCIPR